MISSALSRAARGAPFLTSENEREALIRAKDGDQTARDQIVLAHMRMAIKVAMGFKGYGSSVEDLTHEGVVGLMEAIDRFDLSQEVRFSTYSMWWVKAHVKQYVMRSHSVVRSPESSDYKSMFFSLSRVKDKIAKSGSFSPGQLNNLAAEAFGVKPDVIAHMSSRLSLGDQSINARLGEGGSEFGDHLIDGRALPDQVVETESDHKRRREVIRDALSNLSERERTIVISRFLCDDEDEQTFAELAVTFGCSKQRVQQIAVKTLDKLRRLIGSQQRVVLAR